MTSLLKADFFALIKSKITYIVLFISIAVPVFTVLTDFGLSKLMDSMPDDMPIDPSTLFSAKSIMFSNFSLTNNIGLIIPIFAGILTMADVRNGTIRNKVIIGQNRTKIYLSRLIISVSFCCLASLVSFLMLCGGSLIFFKYGATFDGLEAWNFIKCLLIGLLAFAYVASVSTFIALVTKSTPMTVLLTLVLMVVLGLVSSISGAFPEKYKYIFYLIPTFASMNVASTASLTNELFFFGLGSFIVFISLNSILGIMLFNKADLK